MRLSQVNKILLGSCIVVVPLSFYGGLAIKEYYLSNELEQTNATRSAPHERAMRARIVQLEAERKELLKEGQNLDTKILDIKKRMAEQV
ncbi:hypothetical protein L202_00442 [Cryptococcus amylolentus CBS 6039]|uniref:Uncharacterized protein n=2 Tax=Cryptococcus amylolentus TaxID=104669 RepID=A0A1E3I7B3_9TREE|nr:hypothetical protein L202_00442 [Cryptococcus amylolentus CBS 6039]ODN84510.1 hypothetical protein L202_00442 [Cryptococcus amylolentus CBS 6039]ODO11704.1 hypothetical protein I350_00488 [Cryptococcus amylolentus CBS 6273]